MIIDPSASFPVLMKLSAPEAIVQYVLTQREAAVVRHVGDVLTSDSSAEDHDQINDYLQRFFEFPTNPVFLASALAWLTVTGNDHAGLVGQFLDGQPVQGFESELLHLPNGLGTIELAGVLEMEQRYVEGICVVALANMLADSDARLALGVVKHIWRDIAEQGIPDEIPISVYDVRWRAWRISNPIYAILQIEADYVNASWYRYGFGYNSSFHNARELLEYRLEQHKRKVNELAVSIKNKKALIEQLKENKQEQTILLSLVERARNFYHWNPCEIEAHNFSERFAKEPSKKLPDGIVQPEPHRPPDDEGNES